MLTWEVCLILFSMPISAIQWRVEIGSFTETAKTMKTILNICWLLVNFFAYLFLPSKLCEHGDIETNPGPRKISPRSFSICHWNLNSINAHNFAKVSLLEA